MDYKSCLGQVEYEVAYPPLIKEEYRNRRRYKS